MVSLDSVETRRRLLRRLPDVIIITIILLSAWFFWLKPLLKPQPAPVAPLFSVTTMDGKPFSLAAQRDHMVILDFFATWCEPCQQSLPIVEAFAAENPDVTVLAIDHGESPHVVAAFAKRYHMGRIYIDHRKGVSHDYNVTGLPTLVGIDDEGKVRNVWLGYTPELGDNLRQAKARYEELRRFRKVSKPVRPS